MATTRPFAYNTGSTISATTQVGDLAVGTNDLPVSEGYGGLTWKMGPNEDLGYVIGYPQSGGTQPLPISGTGFVQFWRSKIPGDETSFINLAEYISRKYSTQQVFADGNDAKIWLNNNGFWTSYESGPTPTPSVTSSPTPTASVTPTVTPTPTVTTTNTPTPSPTPQNSLINPIITENDEYIEVGTDEYLMFVDPTTPSVSPTPTNTETQTPTPTNTETPTPTPTNTETPTNTPTNTPTPTATDLSSITTYTISGCSTLNVLVADLGPGALAPSDVFYFDFTGGTQSGCYTIIEKTNSAPTDGTTPLYFYPNCSLCLAANTTPTPTPTITQTPTPSVTQTASATPTNTPTPSATSIPVTGYGFNLVVLPYNPPTSGNTIFPTFASPGLNSGTTNPNTFTTNGVYWNAIDNLGVDRSSYYSGMTGVSVTAYFTQNGNTVIYSGSSTAFTYDGGPGNFAFNYNPNARANQLVLIQSANTNFVTGQTVYISFVVNGAVTPTPTPTMTQTPTETETPTPTPTPSGTNLPPTPTNTETPTNTPTTTPTVTPTNPTLLQILNQTTGSRTVTSCTLDGVSQTLTSGSFPITAGNNGYALTHGQSVLPNSIVFNFGGSGAFDLYSYKNGVLVNYLVSYNNSSYTAGGITLATSDQLVLIITDPGALATPTPTSTPTPTPSAAVLSGLTVNINQVGPNVVMSASGSLNINGLTLVGSNLGPQNGGGIGISTATFIMGTLPSNYDQYSGFTSTPSNFGSGGGSAPSSSSGNIFGCFYPGGPPTQLMVPVGYTTGSAISSTQTFNSRTLASMGLVTGTYTYSWGSGANAYSINVVIS